MATNSPSSSEASEKNQRTLTLTTSDWAAIMYALRGTAERLDKADFPKSAERYRLIAQTIEDFQ
jgi:hypothetical protein